MEVCILENGMPKIDFQALENQYLRLDRSTKETFSMESSMEMVDSFVAMVEFTLVIGKQIKSKDKGAWISQMEAATMENGKLI